MALTIDGSNKPDSDGYCIQLLCRSAAVLYMYVNHYMYVMSICSRYDAEQFSDMRWLLGYGQRLLTIIVSTLSGERLILSGKRLIL